MKEHHYRILTSLSANFDPEVEGSTLDSICESCRDYVSHAIPHSLDKVTINLTLNGELDEERRRYLVGQLEGEFCIDEKVVLGIQEVESHQPNRNRVIGELSNSV